MNLLKTFSILGLLFMTACTSTRPIRTADAVDIDRFMGDWYVIANIPTFIEKEAWNALERYDRRSDTVIDTTFTFNKGGPDGELKTYTPVGFVKDTESNAEWGMRFVWPIKAEYIIVYVDEDYTETIIGRRKRDYLWVMARTPELPEARLEELIQLAVDEGYDREKIRIVPHEVPSTAADENQEQ
jgi:apolipoprotein D and lipocalin family protein